MQKEVDVLMISNVVGLADRLAIYTAKKVDPSRGIHQSPFNRSEIHREGGRKRRSR